jgi:hypothetical protein
MSRLGAQRGEDGAVEALGRADVRDGDSHVIEDLRRGYPVRACSIEHASSSTHDCCIRLWLSHKSNALEISPPKPADRTGDTLAARRINLAGALLLDRPQRTAVAADLCDTHAWSRKRPRPRT